MSAQTHYEIYAFEDQRWILQGRFREGEREAAIEEGKRLERSLYTAVKVVRELYRPGDNSIEEQVVYISDKTLREAAARRASVGPMRGLGQARSESGDISGVPSRGAVTPRTKAAQSMGVLLKLTIVISASLVGASAVTGIVSAVLGKFPEYAVQFTPESMSLLLFSTFVLSFLITAVPLAMSLINWQEDSKARAKEPPKPAPRPTPMPVPVVKPKPKPPVEDKPKEEPPKLPERLPPEEIDPIAEIEAEPSPVVADLPAAEPAPDEPPPPTEPKKDEATVQAELMESLRLNLMRFLTGLLNAVKIKRPQLDAYNKFGVDLMLAGAVEVIGGQHHLESADKRKLLASTIEVMGTRADAAKTFADKYEDYLVEPRYMVMIQSGRSTMESFLAGTDTAVDNIGEALESWNKPQPTQTAPRIITVLFTDMVGSTDMTQSRGDQAAQDVVRRHNSIVRSALAQFSGKEIKHTGDGIMASFASAANGVEAAVAIQKSVANHNAKHPDLTLHLRIGMNAGEPIEEEDDLFGTTVQLAARVCAKSETDQILCTNVVRELSSGKSLDFSSMGGHELKGFRDRVDLFEVVWNSKKKG